MRIKTSRQGAYIELHGVDTPNDYFAVDEVTYQALPLMDNFPEKGRGVNSTVFRAVRGDDEGEFILKVSNISIGETAPRRLARLNRFRREIEAYKKIAESDVAQWVIGFIGSGEVHIGGKNFPCLLLNRGDKTLRELLDEEELPLQQRLLICAELLRSLTALHEIGIYHRDIKPENILIDNGVLKLVDLGLVAFRGEDETVDAERERVGPIWWMAPEAVNKHLCTPWPSANLINKTVGAAADVYQLGKLFWYVIQGDIPNGHIRSRDMRVLGDDAFGSILKPLLYYSASERPTLTEVTHNMTILRRRYAF